MFDILAITGPIYLCILAGWASVRWDFFTKADMRVLGKFVLQIALPALLFNALASRPLAEVMRPGYLLAFTLGSLAVLSLLILPLYIPVLIFATSAIDAAGMGLPYAGQLAILAAMLVGALTLTPLAVSAALRVRPARHTAGSAAAFGSP